MSDISFLIPYRFSDQRRDQNFEFNIRHLSHHFPEASIVVADSDKTMQTPFNRSRARNNAFKESDSKMVCFLDADTVWNPELLWAALPFFMEGFGFSSWLIPYSNYHITTDLGGQMMLGRPSHDTSFYEVNPELELTTSAKEWDPYEPPIAGFNIMRASDFIKTGGYDERFEGWGFEDNAFTYAADQLIGPHRRINGDVWHLWHPVLPEAMIDSPHIEENRNLYGQYRHHFEETRMNFL